MNEIETKTKLEWYDLYKALQIENKKLCERYNVAKTDLQTMRDDRDAFAREAQELRAQNGDLEGAFIRTDSARVQLEYLILGSMGSEWKK